MYRRNYFSDFFINVIQEIKAHCYNDDVGDTSRDDGRHVDRFSHVFRECHEDIVEYEDQETVKGPGKSPLNPSFDPQGQGEEYAALTDRLNDQQISAANVVVIVAPHQYYQQPPNEIVEVLLSGSGVAYAMRDGQLYKVNWNRPTNSSVLFMTFSDGSRYPFKPGKTWFQVVGSNTAVTQPDTGVWRFNHQMP